MEFEKVVDYLGFSPQTGTVHDLHLDVQLFRAIKTLSKQELLAHI
jgi:hypothetical protein